MTEAIWSSDNDIKSRISVGHLATLAARAGCQIHEPAVDRDSVDVTIKPIAGKKIRIDVQLKATTGLELMGEKFRYYLPKKNYDELRATNIDAPQLLVVLDLHEADAHWLVCDHDGSILKKSAYWINLYGWDPHPNPTSVPVMIPKANLLTPETIRDLMNRRFKAVDAGMPGFAP